LFPRQQVLNESALNPLPANPPVGLNASQGEGGANHYSPKPLSLGTAIFRIRLLALADQVEKGKNVV